MAAQEETFSPKGSSAEFSSADNARLLAEAKQDSSVVPINAEAADYIKRTTSTKTGDRVYGYNPKAAELLEAEERRLQGLDAKVDDRNGPTFEQLLAAEEVSDPSEQEREEARFTTNHRHRSTKEPFDKKAA